MTLVPLAGVVISVLVLWKYPIDAKRHAELKLEIAQRRRTTSETSHRSPASSSRAAQQATDNGLDGVERAP
jgi:Na+/melibiose symporter-like transporter